MKTWNIAIDGPAGAGKSTIAKAVAKKLGFLYADTGALYRTVGLACLREQISETEDVIALLPKLEITMKFQEDSQHVYLGTEDVSDKIRTGEVSAAASKFSAIPQVRAFLLDLQKNLAKKENLLMDGRDIGTVVLPNADLKIFLTASPEKRAERRYLEMKDTPNEQSYEEILKEIVQRDFNDSNRKEAPLKRAEDAVLMDTSELTLEESIAAIEQLCIECINK